MDPKHQRQRSEEGGVHRDQPDPGRRQQAKRRERRQQLGKERRIDVSDHPRFGPPGAFEIAVDVAAVRRRLGAAEVIDEVEAQRGRRQANPLSDRPDGVIRRGDDDEPQQDALPESRLVQPADAIPGPHAHAATAGASWSCAGAMRRRCHASSSKATGIAVKPLK